jgi:hypothetical protein
LRWPPYLDAVVSGEVEQSVLEHAPVAGGEDKAVAVEPVRVLGVVPHDLVVEDVAHGRASHGEPRVAGVGLLDGVDGQEPDRVDRLLEQLAYGGLPLERLNGCCAHGALAAATRRGGGRGHAAGRRAQAAAGERAEGAEPEALRRCDRDAGRGARARGDCGVCGGDGVRGHINGMVWMLPFTERRRRRGSWRRREGLCIDFGVRFVGTRWQSVVAAKEPPVDMGPWTMIYFFIYKLQF